MVTEGSREPGNALLMATLLLEMRRPEQALAALDKPTTEQVDDPTFWLLRAQAYFDLKRFIDARDAAAKGLAEVPEHPHLLLMLSMSEAKLGDLAAAERAVLAALQQRPEEPAFLCRYALLLAEGNQLEKAQRLVERAREHAPEDENVRHTELALAYLRGDDKAALQASRQTLAEDPEDAMSHQAIGLLLMEQGRVGAGDRHYRTAARMDPDREEVIKGARRTRVYAHWLLWPLRPFYRWGTVRVWVVAVGTILVLNLLGLRQISRPLSILYIAICVYSWVVPPLIKWWYKRRYGAFR